MTLPGVRFTVRWIMVCVAVVGIGSAMAAWWLRPGPPEERWDPTGPPLRIVPPGAARSADPYDPNPPAPPRADLP
jgi:hypothetical protein